MAKRFHPAAQRPVGRPMSDPRVSPNTKVTIRDYLGDILTASFFFALTAREKRHLRQALAAGKCRLWPDGSIEVYFLDLYERKPDSEKESEEDRITRRLERARKAALRKKTDKRAALRRRSAAKEAKRREEARKAIFAMVS